MEWNGILSEELAKWAEAIRELKAQGREEGRKLADGDVKEMAKELRRVTEWLVDLQEWREIAERKLEILEGALDRQ